MVVICYSVRYISSPRFDGKVVFDINQGNTGTYGTVTSSEDHKALVVGVIVVG